MASQCGTTPYHSQSRHILSAVSRVSSWISELLHLTGTLDTAISAVFVVNVSRFRVRICSLLVDYNGGEFHLERLRCQLRRCQLQLRYFPPASTTRSSPVIQRQDMVMLRAAKGRICTKFTVLAPRSVARHIRHTRAERRRNH